MNGRMEAEAKQMEYVYKLIAGQPVCISQYVDYMNDTSPKTLMEYVRRIILFFNHLKEKKKIEQIDYDILKEVLPLDVKSYLKTTQTKIDKDGKIVKASTSNQALAWSALNSFFKFLMVNRFITDNPMTVIKRPSVTDEPVDDYLEEKEVRKLIKKVKEGTEPTWTHKGKYEIKTRARDIAMIELYLQTGMRASALTQIKLEDLDLENQMLIVIDKGEKQHLYELHPSLCEDISTWLIQREKIFIEKELNDYLFVSIQGTPLTYESVKNIVKKYTKAVGHEVSPHKLRHTFGTMLYKATKDPLLVQREMGHSSFDTTQRYINSIKSRKTSQGKDIMGKFLTSNSSES